jgi:hypothetical protein
MTVHQSPAAAPLASARSQAAAFAQQLTPSPFNTLDTFLAQARRAQAQQPAATAPVKVDFSALQLLLASVKASK